LTSTAFASQVIAWHRAHGRHDLPWQNTQDPYRIWVSEIMLQQTQVATVIPYYRRFMTAFPDVRSLAEATEDAVLAHWSGLGYYSRARNLHQAARQIATRHGGRFPEAFDDIVALPGIGRSTAAAISALAYGARTAILDGNVKRVLARYLAVDGYPGQAQVEKTLWSAAERLLPEVDTGAYTQGIMDLGATLCTRSSPACPRCPVAAGCAAYAQGRVDELPSARPRKALPERETRMLILLRGRDVLLEKRPPAGIWGGLWSLPEADAGEDPQAAALARFGFSIDDLTHLPALVHTFTHFKLVIHPSALRVAQAASALREPGAMWISLADAADAALPTPVRKLLAQVATSDGDAPMLKRHGA
jgi:A/G-specific adenine glycosylase